MDDLIKSLAVRGAQLRAEEITREIDALLAAFPNLASPPPAAPEPNPEPTHWMQTPAGRAQQSARMKEVWKRRRAAADAPRR